MNTIISPIDNLIKQQLESKNSYIRCAGIKSLSKVKNQEFIVDCLELIIKDENIHVRNAGIKSLELIEDNKIFTTLLKIILIDDNDIFGGIDVSDLLLKIDDQKSFAECLKIALISKESGIRWDVAILISKIEDQKSLIDCLEIATNDENSNVRIIATTQLSKIDNYEIFIDYFERAMNDKNWVVRYEGIKHVHIITDQKILIKFIKMALNDKHDSIRKLVFSLESLCLIDDKKIRIQLLTETLLADNNYGIKKHAAELISDSNQTVLIKFVKILINDPELKQTGYKLVSKIKNRKIQIDLFKKAVSDHGVFGITSDIMFKLSKIKYNSDLNELIGIALLNGSCYYDSRELLINMITNIPSLDLFKDCLEIILETIKNTYGYCELIESVNKTGDFDRIKIMNELLEI